jgi:hypothetical protein
MVLEGAPNSGSAVASATASITVQFTQRRRIRIRLVRIHYTGRGLDVAAPTVKDFWDLTDFAQRVLPIPSPGFELVRESVETYDGDFTRIDPCHLRVSHGDRGDGALPRPCTPTHDPRLVVGR